MTEPGQACGLPEQIRLSALVYVNDAWLLLVAMALAYACSMPVGPRVRLHVLHTDPKAGRLANLAVDWTLFSFRVSWAAFCRRVICLFHAHGLWAERAVFVRPRGF